MQLLHVTFYSLAAIFWAYYIGECMHHSGYMILPLEVGLNIQTNILGNATGTRYLLVSSMYSLSKIYRRYYES